MNKTVSRFTIRDLALMGAMTCLLIVSVHALAPLPNVEPVTLLVILFTLFWGKRVAYILTAYLLLEGCFYGFGLWWVMYAYLWPLLALQAEIRVVLEPFIRRLRSLFRSSVFYSLFPDRRPLHGLHLVGSRDSL